MASSIKSPNVSVSGRGESSERGFNNRVHATFGPSTMATLFPRGETPCLCLADVGFETTQVLALSELPDVTHSVTNA